VRLFRRHPLGAAGGLDSVGVATDGLDAEKLQVLGRWAAGLRTDPREELAAAGRAIELLIEEIERLHVLLWGQQLYPETTAASHDLPNLGPPSDGDSPATADGDVSATLRSRLLRKFHSESSSNT
jgi:hypothetical protein